MIWFIISHLFTTFVSLVYATRLSDNDKDLEIAILRHQLDVMVRKQKQPVRASRIEKATLAMLTARLKRSGKRTINQLRDVIRIVQPETVLRWHRELVRRKWTQEKKNKGGRPKMSQVIENLVVRLAQENLRWGYAKIEGELKKLGHRLSSTTVKNILDRHDILPAPVRFGSIGWRKLMSHYKDQLLACDFFTVETICLQTIYVLFFIELGSRRVHLAGITTHPDGLWVAQQARQLIWQLEETSGQFRCLIRDNDSKYTDAFDTVFESQQIHVIPTPIRAPNANAFAERWVRTVREEILDHILVINETHLRRVLNKYLTYYNARRPHQGLKQQSPIPRSVSTTDGTVECRKILGGIINDYFRASDETAVCPA